MKSFKRLGFLAVATLLMVGSIALSPAAQAAAIATENSGEVAELLTDARRAAFQLERDAMEMETFTRSPRLSWYSHTAKITRVKDHVNNVSRLFTKLDAARSTAAPWQQQAIDQIEPILKQLVTNTTAAIEHINENQGNLHDSSYKDYLVANYEASTELRELIADFVDYGEATEKVQALDQKLFAER